MLVLVIALAIFGRIAGVLPDQRPSYEDRTFHSKAIDDLISSLVPLFNDADIATIFQNSLPNTLDTTVYYTTANPASTPTADLDSFVITGDIDALWLRDSMNQVLPYIPYAAEDQSLQYLIEGLINRQAKSVILDPFANAFNFNASGSGHQSDQRTPAMSAGVFEGKYEIDSLNAFVKLSYWYWRCTSDTQLASFANANWLHAMDVLLETIGTMQKDTGRLANPPYLFSRVTGEALDTLSVQSRGPPCQPNGMTRSLFRPSDDAVTLPYNLPGNAMACVELKHLQEMLSILSKQASAVSQTAQFLLQKSLAVSSPLCHATQAYLIPSRGLPYEVDGFGGAVFMDDANLPSLLSLPVMGYLSSNHPVYLKTRENVLSDKNPYYYSGNVGRGIGGPHEGVNLTWPMAIIMQAMTSSSDEEIKQCLSMLKSTTAGTGLMHEAFNVNNDQKYTRSWFAWANGLFGEMILQLIMTKPQLVLKNDPEMIAKAQGMVKPPISLQAQKEVLIR